RRRRDGPRRRSGHRSRRPWSGRRRRGGRDISRLDRLPGQLDDETGAAPTRRVDPHAAVVEAGVLGHERGAEAGATGRAVPGHLAPGEPAEDVTALVLGHPRAVVLDGDANGLVIRGELDAGHTAAIAFGVLDQVDDHAAQAALV